MTGFLEQRQKPQRTTRLAARVPSWPPRLHLASGIRPLLDTPALSVPNAGPATQILTATGQETSTKRETMKCLGSRRDGTAREP